MKTDMDEIIEMLTVKVTEDRPRLFGALEIDWQSIEAELPTGASLKRRTEACLDTWFTEQQLKYWKYQELLYAFRDSELDSEVDSIIVKFGIKGKPYFQQVLNLVPNRMNINFNLHETEEEEKIKKIVKTEQINELIL